MLSSAHRVTANQHVFKASLKGFKAIVAFQDENDYIALLVWINFTRLCQGFLYMVWDYDQYFMIVLLYIPKIFDKYVA